MTFAHEQRDFDPIDNALAYVTLDGEEVTYCTRCDRQLYRCSCCEFCEKPRCICEPVTQRDDERMRRRYYGGKRWDS